MSVATHAARHRDRPFAVPIAALRREPGSRRQVELAGAIDDLAVSGSRVPDGAEARIDALLESVHDGILVTGTVAAPWVGSCRRCLEAASGELAVAVRELCVEEGDEETTYELGRDELDVEPIVHDACILALPLAPLCSEGCLGLCPECGANRNLERCDCAPSPDPRWGALSELEAEAPQARSATGADRSGRDARKTTE